MISGMPRALVGVILGASIGLLFLAVGTFAAIPAAVAIGWSLLFVGRRLALGGIVLGLGGCWLVLIAFNAANRCTQTATSGCTAPDLLPLGAIASVGVAVGLLLILAGARAKSAAA